jgi:hypothetical protein
MYSGFAWNRNCLLDMLGDPAGAAFNPNVVREVMYLLMFPPKVELSQIAFHVMMDLMTGVTFAGEMNVVAESRHAQEMNGVSRAPLERISSEASMLGGGDVAASSHGVAVLRHDLAKAEKLLWALLTAHDENAPIAVPSKAEAATCLKLYRRVLHSAQWKPDTLSSKRTPQSGLFSFVGLGASSFSRNVDDENDLSGGGVDSTPSILLEIEELFCTINLLSALCKALVLAHKTHDKKAVVRAAGAGAGAGAGADALLTHDAEVPSFGELFSALPVGTKSDVANSVLECLNSCTFLWKRRFDANLMATFRETNYLLPAKSASIVLANGTTVIDAGKGLVSHTIKEANKRFLLQDTPTVPACAVFKVATKHLPLPKSVHDFIQRLFTR